MPHHFVEVETLCDFAEKRFLSVLHTSEFYGEQATPLMLSRIARALRDDAKHPDIEAEIPEWARPAFENLSVQTEFTPQGTALVLYSGNLPLRAALTAIQAESTSTP